MPYSIFIVNSAPGCSLPDDSSVISDVVTNLKSFHATGGMLKRRRLQRKQLHGQKWQELQRGISSFGILHAQVTQLRNLYTCSVKKKKKAPVLTINRKQSYKKKENLWTHKATKEAGIFLFTVSIFYTHIFIQRLHAISIVSIQMAGRMLMLLFSFGSLALHC